MTDTPLKMLLVATHTVLLTACLERSDLTRSPGSDDSDTPSASTGDAGTNAHEDPPPGDPTIPGETPLAPSDDMSPVDQTGRRVDYSEALRTAALKLVGALPTLDEAIRVRDRASYEAQIDRYLADPRLRRQLMSYFRDMMKLGGTIDVDLGNNQRVTVSLETAPRFATLLGLQDRPLTELFTASSGTCPEVDANGNLTPRDCAGGGPTAGVLTDPGAMAQFYSNMAFRRTRWVQEAFDCTLFPAEYSSTPVMMGAGQYVSPWAFESIAGSAAGGGPVDFHDTTSVVCANCHATMNHIAPLFGNYDAAGRLAMTPQVHTPTPENPLTELSHWLPRGEGFAWRFDKPVNNIVGLGQTMARDPSVMRCQVARAWNWAMGRADIADDLAIVPTSITKDLEQSFEQGGFRLKPLLKAIFTHADFLKF